MYNMPLPVAAIRTRIRQEFERHRYANKLSVVDVLLFKSHAEYQVRADRSMSGGIIPANARMTGNHELLEADQPRHVILQGRELPGRQAIAVQLHDRFPRGKGDVLSS